MIKEKDVLEIARDLLRRHGKITTNMVASYFGVSPSTARKYLNKLVKKRILAKLGKGRATYYSYG